MAVNHFAGAGKPIRRDPGRDFLAAAQVIVWGFCFVKGLQWIFAAVVIAGMEMADRARPVIEAVRQLVL